VTIRLDTLADAALVEQLAPDVVLVATGGLPREPELASGTELVTPAWDVLSGHVRAAGQVLFYDDAGTHSSLTAAQYLAEGVESLEILTPERTLGVDVGGLTYTGYAGTLVEHDVRVTLNHRLLAVHRDGGRLVATIGSDHSSRQAQRVVDLVVAELGTDANDELYLELRDRSGNGGAVDYAALVAGLPQPLPAPSTRQDTGGFALYRIGDAVASRNVHAAIYDAQRLCTTL